MRCLVLVGFFTIVSQISSKSVRDGQYAYSDSLARNFMMPACAAVEAEDPKNCLQSVHEFWLKRHVTVICDELNGIDTCSALTAVDHEQKAILITYRGTKGKIQLGVESLETLLRNRTEWVAGGHVSSYFYKAFFDLWNAGIKDDFIALAHTYPTYDLWITGHSLGGAMASLAASYVGFNKLFPVSQIKMISLGQPRTGDSAYANAFDQLIPYAYRIVHAKDIVTHIPLKGQENFRHHKSEVSFFSSINNQ
ncbi:hypothetical protein WR25_05853 [Diploscapter pachys]|uniref:Fungal lipase-type domain-containing protein n=1 Tax=Diploscapter pachys TaxID=2018661 RepID=A0A2A2L709_9BILA|nr:hypothetical protein WR25_05853 [Diploscapter pachys]